MPPGGLYPMPRHHLYGSRKPLKVYSTKDFEEPEAEINVEAVDADEAENLRRKDEKRLRKEERRKRKELKKQQEVAPNTDHMQTEVPSPIKVNAAAPSDGGKVERKKKKKAEAEKSLPEASHKKRKRESKAGVNEPTAPQNDAVNGSFVVGTDMVKTLKQSMGNLGQTFNQMSLPEPLPQKTSKVKKKKASKKTEAAEKNVVQQSEPVGAPESPETPTKKRQKRLSDNGVAKKMAVPFASRLVRPVARTLNSGTPQQSFVPLPPSSQWTASQQKQSAPEVLVPETPVAKSRSKPIQKAPVPFSLSQPSTTSKSAKKTSNKARLTLDVSPPTSTGGSQSATTQSATSKPKKGRKSEVKPKFATSLLSKFIQPLRDNVTRASSRQGSVGTSVGTSMAPSSASSVDLPEQFNRVGKPYARSGALVDPFTTREPIKKKHRETHEEAPMQIFDEKFSDMVKTVNFTEESDYLNSYLDWSSLENDPIDKVPCLGQVTGCTSKKEEIFRLSREEGINIMKLFENGTASEQLIAHANTNGRNAEGFLITAIRARVPVPIGPVEGEWTLYCPKYSVRHVDKYSGLRAMKISSISGFNDKNMFTARLSLPPRPGVYSTLTFSTPPHASFRTTTLTTAAERNTMEVIFFGNGFLHLRMDLKLFLTGRPIEMVDGKSRLMEFIGVHEKALRWEEPKDELQEMGKKVFEKYGHIDSD
ncbi:hypothetical protein BDV95DRAFT_590734 [Massariosphaeria phaeospora]|uniref:Uncharacterized protein n=1 Tax=Massariosphaeria phaeospora TaxID=100035 RepID=A0A7C8MG07_9PLEO|nr:hypothetical protein BDV95DRAFT_590734 [Massariosphaeria phaeospora]